MPVMAETKSYHLQPELLSPAGDSNSLRAAIINGADAVYLGTKEFNARVHAGNFTLKELEQAVVYCHNQGVRVYLTLNTLVKNSELSRFMTVLSQAYSAGIDGVILQHISLVDIVKRNYPGLAVFISTQAAIGNTPSASLFKNADRIILPREILLADVKKIADSGINVEVFVHGALCFSFSGLCLFSSFVGGRSGNRGSCAQLCRQKYNGEYPLSTRELCLVRRIPELIKAGIRGFKIEGRMRSPLYVAVATRLYRKAIDSFLSGDFRLPEKEMDEISVVFNREFTEGFTGGNKDLVAPEKPMNRGAFLGDIEGKEILLQHRVMVGDGVGIWGKENVTGAVIREITLEGRSVNEADTGRKVALGIDAKEGSRIYLTSSSDIKIEPDFSLQRTPLLSPKRIAIKPVLPQTRPVKAPSLKLLARVYSLSEAKEASRAGADLVFYNIFSPDFPELKDWSEKAVLGAYIPRILNDNELVRALAFLMRKKPAAVLTGNLGILAHRKEFSASIYLDYSMNIFNDIDILFFKKWDAVPVLSPELSLADLTGTKDRNCVIFCHGDIVLVNTKIELKTNKLVDEKGLSFPVRKEGSYWQILNSLPFGVFNDIRKLRTIGFNQFFIDREDQAARFVSLYRTILEQGATAGSDRRLRKGYTAGHLYRGVD
jgi:collagenase-like PrtC family protease